MYRYIYNIYIDIHKQKYIQFCVDFRQKGNNNNNNNKTRNMNISNTATTIHCDF